MRAICLGCGHEWESRGPSSPRQCPKCWGRGIAGWEEVRLARLFLRPWVAWSQQQLPRLPSPREGVLLPLVPLVYHGIMARAKSAAERQRVAALMLREDGLEANEATRLAAQMFPEG